MKIFSVLPNQVLRSLLVNWDLFWALLRRDIAGRYKGSLLGLLWSLVHPVLMLAVYVFVFGEIFRSRWSGGGESTASYALVLFCGLIVFNLFAEVVNRSPQLVVDNANYVKKVVFPLELLSLVSLGTAIFHALISFFIWMIFHAVMVGAPSPIGIVYFLLALMPLILLAAGLSWFVSALGVFLRDISQLIGIVTSALLFLSPIFYPLSAVPDDFMALIQLNPLAQVVEQARSVLIYGKSLNFVIWSMQMFFAFIAASLGFAWFQKTRKGFSDVL